MLVFTSLQKKKVIAINNISIIPKESLLIQFLFFIFPQSDSYNIFVVNISCNKNNVNLVKSNFLVIFVIQQFHNPFVKNFDHCLRFHPKCANKMFLSSYHTIIYLFSSAKQNPSQLNQISVEERIIMQLYRCTIIMLTMNNITNVTEKIEGML